MTERNPCQEIGCLAACCGNIHGQFPKKDGFFHKAFPNAIRVDSEDETLEKIRSQEIGVYYFEDENWIYFAVSGVCQNLMEDLSCGIHSKPFYPKPCKNMVVGSRKCLDSQIIFQSNLEILSQ